MPYTLFVACHWLLVNSYIWHKLLFAFKALDPPSLSLTLHIRPSLPIPVYSNGRSPVLRTDCTLSISAETPGLGGGGTGCPSGLVQATEEELLLLLGGEVTEMQMSLPVPQVSLSGLEMDHLLLPRSSPQHLFKELCLQGRH